MEILILLLNILIFTLSLWILFKFYFFKISEKFILNKKSNKLWYSEVEKIRIPTFIILHLILYIGLNQIKNNSNTLDLTSGITTFIVPLFFIFLLSNKGFKNYIIELNKRKLHLLKKVKTSLSFKKVKLALTAFLTYLNIDIKSEDYLDDFIFSFFDIKNNHNIEHNKFNFIPTDKALEFAKFILYLKNMKLIDSNKTDIVKRLEKIFHKKGKKDGFSYRSLIKINCKEENTKKLIPDDDIRRDINSILKI